MYSAMRNPDPGKGTLKADMYGLIARMTENVNDALTAPVRLVNSLFKTKDVATRIMVCGYRTTKGKRALGC